MDSGVIFSDGELNLNGHRILYIELHLVVVKS